MTNELYVQVVQITEVYLGPAASRFVSRQVERHLHKQPAQINLQDLRRLSDEIKVSLALLTEDRTIVDEFAERIGLLEAELAGRRR